MTGPDPQARCLLIEEGAELLVRQGRVVGDDLLAQLHEGLLLDVGAQHWLQVELGQRAVLGHELGQDRVVHPQVGHGRHDLGLRRDPRRPGQQLHGLLYRQLVLPGPGHDVGVSGHGIAARHGERGYQQR